MNTGRRRHSWISRWSSKEIKELWTSMARPSSRTRKYWNVRLEISLTSQSDPHKLLIIRWESGESRLSHLQLLISQAQPTSGRFMKSTWRSSRWSRRKSKIKREKDWREAKKKMIKRKQLSKKIRSLAIRWNDLSDSWNAWSYKIQKKSSSMTTDISKR